MFLIIKISKKTKDIVNVLGYVESLTKARDLSEDLNFCLSPIKQKSYLITFEEVKQIG